MKLFSVLIAFKIEDQVIERTINDVHTIMFESAGSIVTEQIEQFMKGKRKVTRYLTFDGDKIKFDIQYPDKVLYLEIYSI